MRVFCTIVSLLLFAALAISVIMFGQWLSINGPEWLVACGYRREGNPPIVLSCVVTLAAMVVSTGLIIASIWGEK